MGQQHPQICLLWASVCSSLHSSAPPGSQRDSAIASSHMSTTAMRKVLSHWLRCGESSRFSLLKQCTCFQIFCKRTLRSDHLLPVALIAIGLPYCVTRASHYTL